MKLGKFSIGVGDRFSHQGKAQLRAIMKANKSGLEINPVWNKSNREHTYVYSEPVDTRKEADDAVKALGYKGAYFVDADHINLSTVDRFIDVSDFFTLDVASFIGKPSAQEDVDKFITSCKKYMGDLHIPGIEKPISVTKELLEDIAHKFLSATQQAADIYQYWWIKRCRNFITEVSMDEVENRKLRWKCCSYSKCWQTRSSRTNHSSKFTGRFNKGVDYVGDLKQFAKEFEEDVLVIDFAVKEFGLPEELKLSVHSGSDKFSIYPIMAEVINRYDKGLHLKTAGTTWLEEVIGLAKAGGDGLALAKKIYANSLNRKDELCAPYADVIDIDGSKLPTIEEVNAWTSEQYQNALRHIPEHPEYNSNFRQLIHVAYAVAAELGKEYTDLLVKYEDIVGGCVEENIYERHLKRLFAL